MDAMSLIPARQLSAAQLASLVSRAYANYYYQVAVTEAQFSQICLEEDVDLAQSVVALHQGEAAGLALLSRRAERGWISAVGVLPSYRRRGIARAMICDLQRRARALALHSVTLEVLAQNRPGLALYAQLGFVQRRKLLLLILEPHAFVPGTLSSSKLSYSVVEAPPAALLAHFDAFHAVEHAVPPSWQQEYATLHHRLPQLTGLSYRENGALTGYVLFQPQRSYQLIHDLAVAPEAAHPLSIAETLLMAVHRQRPHVGGYVINVAEGAPLLAAYTALHYRTVHRQHELIWEVEAGCELEVESWEVES